MTSANLARLETWDKEKGHLNVVIETPKGSRNKYKYEPKQGLFRLSNVLPLGSIFPYDFGFVPSTVGEDGDPLDVLLLMDEPAFPGCLIHARLLGVIEAEQTEDGNTVRNDRLIAVACKCCTYEDIASLKHLGEEIAKEIEHFFVAYNQMERKEFRPIGHHGPHRAEKIIQEGIARFQPRNTAHTSSRKSRHRNGVKQK